MGYAGGTAPDPTYDLLGDHTECIQVDYDPARIPYEDLVEAFWAVHSPLKPALSTQYASLILCHDAEQLSVARASRERVAGRVGRRVHTEVRMLDRFYVAEDYHQKHALRGDSVLVSEVHGYCRDEASLRDSTAAARLNGYAYGLGSRVRVEMDIESLGLSDVGARHLRSIVRNGR